jgi:hypothetical protein
MTTATKARPKDKPSKRATIVEAMDTIFKPWFPGDTWGGWTAVLKAMDALPDVTQNDFALVAIAGQTENLTSLARSKLVLAVEQRPAHSGNGGGD